MSSANERIRRWIDEGRPVNATVELLAEVDRLRADNEALRLLNLERQEVINEYDRVQAELVIHWDALQRERDALWARTASQRAQVEAVLALADEADALIEERGLRRNGFIKSIRAALDKETNHG